VALRTSGVAGRRGFEDSGVQVDSFRPVGLVLSHVDVTAV
jgi:hypothetical protein